MLASNSDPLQLAYLLASIFSLDMAKEQKRDVYVVETMGGEAPRLLFCVHPDGSRQLVRGAVFDELDIRSLRSDIILESWLHETTRLTALSFLRGERRRQFREQEAYMQFTQQESADVSIWNQLAPHIKQGELYHVRLFETPRNFADYYGSHSPAW